VASPIVPQPNESVYSILSRLHVRSGHASPFQTLERFVGVRGYKPQNGLPGSLCSFVSRSGLCLSTTELIAKHTDFPLYTHFFSARRKSRLIRSMEGTGATKSLLGLLRSHVGASDTRRFCVACAKDDIENIGFPYWRRGHNLPGWLVCPIHSLDLHVVSHSRNTPFERDLRLPPYDCVLRGKGSDDRLIKLSYLLQSLLSNPVKVRFDSNFYLRLFSDLDLLTASNRVRQRLLTDAVLVWLQPVTCYEPFARLRAALDIERNWTASLIDRDEHFHHPLKHFIVWLSFDVDLEDAINTAAGTERQIELDLPEPVARFSLEEIDRCFKHCRTLTEAANCLGCSVTTAATLARANGYSFRSRAKLITDGMRSEILNYCANGSTTREAAKHFSISVSSVNRIRREFRRNDPEIPRTNSREKDQ